MMPAAHPGAREQARLEYIQQLGQALQFPPEALAANQRGQLHPAQVARGQRAAGRKTIFGVVWILIGLMLLGGGVGLAGWLYDDHNPKYPWSQTDLNAIYFSAGGGAILFLGCLAIAISCFRGAGRVRAAFAAGRVDVSQGPLQRVEHRGSASAYIWRVGGQQIWLSKRDWELGTPGAQYRVFSVPDFGIVAIEPL